MRRAVVIGTLAFAALPAWAAPGDTTPVSVSDGGIPGTTPALGAAVSGDGSLVLFTSRSALTPAGANGALQLYVRDRLQGRTRLVSASPAGSPANGDVVDEPGERSYAISADGRYAVFMAAATNLVAGDANGAVRDVFRKDLRTGAVIVASRSSTGAQPASAVAGAVDVSADGSRVAFTSGAVTGLVPGDASPDPDVLVRDVPAGTTVAANRLGSAAPLGPATRPAISADGRFVAFEAGAGAAGLVPGDANGAADVVVADIASGALTRASVHADGSSPGGATHPDLSGDGRYVAFLSATPFTTGAPPRPNVYRRDTTAGATTLVSARDGASTAGDGAAGRPSMTADGQRVAFDSTSADLVVPDGNGASVDAYTRDVTAVTTRRVGLTSAGVQTVGGTAATAIAGNGGAVALAHDDAGGGGALTPGDVNGQPDVFARELVPGDVAGPVVSVAAPAAGFVTADRSVAVSVTATDPSGVAAVFAAGRRLRRAGDVFTGTVPVAAGTAALDVVAVDGAGNPSRVSPVVTRQTAPGGAPTAAARPSGLRAVVARRSVLLRFRLSGPAVVIADVRRMTLRGPRLAPLYADVARSARTGRRAGAATVVVKLRRPLAAGPYRMRVTAVSAGGVTQSALTVRVGGTG